MMTNRETHLHDALQQLVDWVKDGCPEDGYVFAVREAEMALKGMHVIRTPPEVTVSQREFSLI